jgi:thiamine biosynthesis protein ThiS
MITITVNGETRSVPASLTLSGLLAQLQVDPRMVVVEHNRTIVRRVGLDGVTVAAGDEIEIVQFVGGG